MMTRLIIFALLLAVANAQTPTCDESCYEKCFQVEGTEDERFREVYDNILEIGLELQFLKNLYNIDKVGFLFDSALSSRHSFDERGNTDNLENGHNIFHFEVYLVMALAFIIHAPSNYLVQYNEDSAWTCDEFNCMANDACEFIKAIQYQVPIELNPTSHCPGNIEAACKLMHNQMTDITCTDANQNTMVIAIADGDFYINDPFRHRRSHHSSSSSSSESREEHLCPPYKWGGLGASSSSSSSEDDGHDFFSPCHSYFNTRYVVGTHTAPREVMELFPSKHGNYRYIHDSEFGLYALNNLLWCMTKDVADPTQPGCCPAGFLTAPLAPLPVTCKKTQGPFGEIVNPMPTHPAIAATGIIIPVPVDPTGSDVMMFVAP